MPKAEDAIHKLNMRAEPAMVSRDLMAQPIPAVVAPKRRKSNRPSWAETKTQVLEGTKNKKG